MMNMEAVHQIIDGNREEYLYILKKLCAQPSLAAENVGIQECCELVCELLRMIGIEPQVFPTGGSPVVFGELKSSVVGAKTIMFYGHYDVQPAGDLSLWETPPFEPTVRNNRIYGRGTADNKGQFLAHILAIHAFQEAGINVPVNVKFFLEGEEENGSVHILDFIEPHKDILKADIVYNSDGGMHDSGTPLITHGVRGMLMVQLDLETSIYDNHSGNKGGQIPNAAWQMVRFLGSLVDENGRCAIPGFYDDVVEPTEFELELIDRMEFNPESLAAIYGVAAIELDKRDFYTNLMFQPTFNINGVYSGHVGEGTRTIIPGHARATMDMRLAYDQDPDVIYQLLEDAVAGSGMNITLKKLSAVPPSSTSPELEICKVIAQAIEVAYGQKPFIMPRLGATNPEYVFTKILGLASLTVPYANADENNHAPDENFDLDLFYQGIKATAEVIRHVGWMPANDQ